jgi:hypothetical protein
MALVVVAVGGLTLAAGTPAKTKQQKEPRVFEQRTYYAAPGKMEALHKRFREHTNRLFEKHGMRIIGFWSPLDKKAAEEKLIYILAFPSKAAADQCWDAFRKDPDWLRVKEASERDGKLVERVESVYMKATDYSPMK